MAAILSTPIWIYASNSTSYLFNYDASPYLSLQQLTVIREWDTTMSSLVMPKVLLEWLLLRLKNMQDNMEDQIQRLGLANKNLTEYEMRKWLDLRHSFFLIKLLRQRDLFSVRKASGTGMRTFKAATSLYLVIKISNSNNIYHVYKHPSVFLMLPCLQLLFSLDFIVETMQKFSFQIWQNRITFQIVYQFVRGEYIP